MKHALLLEVLERTIGWPDQVYAETHAGAGVYLAQNQKVGEKHIDELWEIVAKACDTSDGPGFAYLSWLKHWWGDTANRGWYPGSAVTALQCLNRMRPSGEPIIRLTERNSVACDRLRRALGPRGAHAAKSASFLEELDWLMERDNLGRGKTRG